MATETLDRERERMHQYRVDAEVAATERSIQRLMVPGQVRFPGLAVLDPYFLAATEPRRLIVRLAEVALSRSSADRITVLVSDWDDLVVVAFSGEQPAHRADSGVPVVRSIPLIAATGRVLGVLSCRYGGFGPGIEEDRPLLDLLADAAALLLQWHGVGEDAQGPAPVRQGGRTPGKYRYEPVQSVCEPGVVG